MQYVVNMNLVLPFSIDNSAISNQIKRVFESRQRLVKVGCYGIIRAQYFPEVAVGVTYKEYLRAARKHLSTCIVIREALTTLDPSAVENHSKIKQLTLNLYYLSGYVIECAVKYAIYVEIKYDKNQHINQLDTTDISYRKHIQRHRFDRYVDHLNSRHGGIILIDNKQGISREVKKLYHNWDAPVRYCYDEIPNQFKHSDEFEHVLTFSQYAEQIFTHIQSNIR